MLASKPFAPRAALFSVVALAACTNTLAGTGPIKLSPRTQAAFTQGYLRLDTPLAFAVSEDGETYGATACPESACRGMFEHDAIRSCEQRSHGKRCYLYAVGRQVVWRTDLPPPAK